MLGKSRHNTLGAKTLAKMADVVPFGLANIAAGIYSKYNIKDLHRPPFNVTITNVPGPRGPLYLNGHKVVSIFGLTPVVDGFGLIIAAFSYNGQVSITATSDAKTMPDADLFSRYIRESANELEVLVKDLAKGKLSSKTVTKVKCKSAPFFTALKRYLKTNEKELKKYKGIYQIQVDCGDSTDGWEIDLTKEVARVKKKKNLDAKVLVEIEDENLFALYKGKFLLEELKIQGRIKISGNALSEAKIMKLFTAFLER
jgi:diacylglycerol O-acyltransferase